MEKYEMLAVNTCHPTKLVKKQGHLVVQLYWRQMNTS